LQKAVRIASLNPASVSDAQQKGKIQAGADADILALSENGEVRATVIRGQIIEN
jgi:N-acetylglucosamine-6-phosphate deacetylase